MRRDASVAIASQSAGSCTLQLVLGAILWRSGLSAGQCGTTVASCGAANEFYGCSQDCTRYIHCTGMLIGSIKMCSSGNVFDKSVNICNFPGSADTSYLDAGVQCPPAPPPPPSPPPPRPPPLPPPPPPPPPPPTAFPSASPTGAPTKYPTRAPTSFPSAPPSRGPSRPPTASPAPPSAPPTAAPTEPPSAGPTAGPRPPSSPPSGPPSESPTRAPSRAPTLPPSAAPIAPSGAPSSAPTQQPTVSPSVSPLRPTSSPTVPPTVTPTGLPSAAPNDPTSSPSPPPTFSPSASPSPGPTRAPSTAPTQMPTDSPSAAPLLPTDTPSATPTSPPSQAPSSPPYNPTMSPSSTPTRSPSVSPSLGPTASPSGAPLPPTRVPSASPSEAPSSNPTAAPTLSPSALPTTAPSRLPSASPEQPTRPPSFPPTRAPTPSPSNAPTQSPTEAPLPPSNSPSGVPTTSPSGAPSSAPSSQPSPFPSHVPSGAPSAAPKQPTALPSFSPTSAPTTSPSRVPTMSPTEAPAAPANQPTEAPAAPSPNPSVRPTLMPFRSPTVAPSISPSSRSAPPTAAPGAAAAPPSVSPLDPFTPTASPQRLPTRSPGATDSPTIQGTTSPGATDSPTIQGTTSPAAAIGTSLPGSVPPAAPTVSPTPPPSSGPAPLGPVQASPTISPSLSPIQEPLLAQGSVTFTMVTAPAAERSVVVLSMVTGASPAALGTLAIASDVRCDPVGTMRELSPALHPTGVSSGDGFGGQCMGCLIGGALLLAGATAFSFGALLVVRRLGDKNDDGILDRDEVQSSCLRYIPVIKNSERIDVASIVRHPNTILLVALFLYQGMSYCSVQLIFDSLRGADWASPFVLWVSGVYAGALLGFPFWLRRKLIDGVRKKVHSDLPGRAATEEKVYARVRPWDHPKPPRWMQLVLLSEQGDWVSCFRSKHWINQCEAAVRPFEAEYAVGGASMDLITMFALGAANAIPTPSYTACGHVRVAAALVNLVTLVYHVWKRPYRCLRDDVCRIMLLLLLVAALLSIATGFYRAAGSLEDWERTFGQARSNLTSIRTSSLSGTNASASSIPPRPEPGMAPGPAMLSVAFVVVLVQVLGRILAEVVLLVQGYRANTQQHEWAENDRRYGGEGGAADVSFVAAPDSSLLAMELIEPQTPLAPSSQLSPARTRKRSVVRRASRKQSATSPDSLAAFQRLTSGRGCATPSARRAAFHPRHDADLNSSGATDHNAGGDALAFSQQSSRGSRGQLHRFSVGRGIAAAIASARSPRMRSTTISTPAQHRTPRSSLQSPAELPALAESMVDAAAAAADPSATISFFAPRSLTTSSAAPAAAGASGTFSSARPRGQSRASRTEGSI
eukprot:TRINITY_DN9693_c0_g1_i1.p1 TRINITY_DN9693_c0_g1~~TRINITY_DN9693_c0_g1_i1.p1  ORF type:complete len:1355 (+),score=136.47 TRINITY_DN9693_c0_g1_i1:61-4125(+)